MLVRYFVLSIICLIPSSVLAAVSISEVAWMGSTASANHEWIELRNDGGAVDVSGWIIRDGLNLSVVLTGTLPANSYSVLERTSDASAPGTAFLIYTGALVNGGTTLTLADKDGNTIDRVVGGENWEAIGGDNTTKDTAQYTSSGWVTDTPTPGAVNGRGRVDVPDDTPPNTPPTSTTTIPKVLGVTSTRGGTQVTKGTTRATIPRSAIVLEATIPEVAFVGQHVYFDVTAAWVQPQHQKLVEFMWNFGDGTATSGRSVTHVYEYPGTYIVTIEASREDHTQLARGTITVLPSALSLSVTDTVIHVHNNAVYETNVSGYTVRGLETFRFPDESIMAPRGTITLPRAVVGKTHDTAITLRDRQSAIIARAGEVEQVPQDSTALSDAGETVALEAVSYGTEVFDAPAVRFGANVAAAADSQLLAPVLSIQDEVMPAVDPLTLPAEPPPRWPYAALCVVILCGMAAIWPRALPSQEATPSVPSPFPFS